MSGGSTRNTEAALFGRVLKHWRVQNHLSQRVVGKQLGVHTTTIGAWERGERLPKSKRLLEQVAAAIPLSGEEHFRLLALTQGQQRIQQQEAAEDSPRPAPLYWNIPYRRNPYFTGRSDIVTGLRRALRTRQAVALTQPQAITGLGGIGKTQIAIEYAYRYKQEYQAVLWISAASRELLLGSFVALASLLGLPESAEADQNLIVAAVQRWLRAHEGWLLILDNLEDFALANEFLPSAYLGHILLTTRAHAVGNLAESLDVEKMTTETGALLLLRRAGIIKHHARLEQAAEADQAKAQELSKLLGGLPIALDQAGAYIQEIGCGLAGYLERYQQEQARLLNERGTHDTKDYPDSVVTTWSLSFEKIQKASSAAADLLHFCAFLAPDGIPEEILVEDSSHEPNFPLVAADPFQFNLACKELLRFSLIHREPDSKMLSIHRLVQAVIKDKMDVNLRHQFVQRVVQTVNSTFPAVEFVTWSRCQRLIIQAQACATLIEQWHMEVPEATRLLNQTAYYLEDRAQYREAEPYYLRVLTIRERVLEAEHPDRAKTLNNLGSLYHRLGKYKQAEPLLQRALTIREQALGAEHPETAQSLNNLAVVYEKQGKFGQAEPLYQRALTIREHALGSLHPDTAMSLNNVALFYEKQGKFGQAEPLYQRALTIREQALGPLHPDTAMSLNNLAALYRKQGKYQQAEAFYQRALVINEQAHDPDHPDTINILNNLAALHYTQGAYEKAEPLFEYVLAVRERVLGSEHPSTAITLNNLALLYLKQDKDDQAEPLFLRSLTIRKRVFGMEHPTTATCLANLADLYKKQGKYTQSEPLYGHALAINERMLGAEHPTTVEVRENYARLLERMKLDQGAAK